MTVTLRSYEQILADALNYIEVYSDVDDKNIGSIVRTMMEAIAEESNEQYFQLSQILKAFSIFSARGANLDRRVADFGLARNLAKTASTRVRFYDSTVVVGKVSQSAALGATSLKFFDSTVYPTTGYPYQLRINEGTPYTQMVTVSNNNLSTSTLTVSALTYAVDVGSPANLVTGTVGRVINAGVQVVVPADLTSSARLFVTKEQAYIAPGNTYSNEVYARAAAAGPNSNGPAGSIKGFASSPPFSGATVANTTACTGGALAETDEALQRRAVEQIFGFSAATKLSLKAAAKRVVDKITGKQVRSASIVEDFANNEVLVYVDDGTGSSFDSVLYPLGSAAGITAGASSITMTSNFTEFPEKGEILVIGSTTSELLSYTHKVSPSLRLASNAVYTHSAPTVYMVDKLSTGTELNQKLFRLTNKPVVRDSEIVFYKTPLATTWSQLSRGLYTINRSTGDITLATAFITGTQIVATYSYNVNLAAEVSKVLEGDFADSSNYPGVKAAGTRISIETPIIRSINVTLLITAKQGYDEATLRETVKKSVEFYIGSLEIGQDVVASRIVKAAQDITEVESVRLVSPTDDIVLLEKELASAFSSSGDSLVSVV